MAGQLQGTMVEEQEQQSAQLLPGEQGRGAAQEEEVRDQVHNPKLHLHEHPDVLQTAVLIH